MEKRKIKIETDRAIYNAYQTVTLDTEEVVWRMDGTFGKSIVKDRDIRFSFSFPKDWADTRIFQFIMSIDKNFE